MLSHAATWDTGRHRPSPNDCSQVTFIATAASLAPALLVVALFAHERCLELSAVSTYEVRRRSEPGAVWNLAPFGTWRRSELSAVWNEAPLNDVRVSFAVNRPLMPIWIGGRPLTNRIEPLHLLRREQKVDSTETITQLRLIPRANNQR